uniref:Uncharacterized protein n=1 Tax=Tanacetum cinerariifolium TaxID=118510 RepID=A0A6L2NVT8_TANCI|nr:hypothetical protein [Tanacetum cinerariifolium]
MDTTIDQQVAMDEALVPHAKRLRIERNNFRLSNTKSQRRAMRCIILDSRRLSSTILCQRIRPFQGGTRNSNAYKEYYAVSTGAAPPKPKASVRKTSTSSDTTITPPTATADERTGSIPRVPDVPTDESEEELSWNSTKDEGDDKGKDGDGDDDDDNGDDGEEGDGDDDDDDDDDGEEGKKATMKRKRKMNYKETSILIKEGQSSSVSLQFVTSMLNSTLDEVKVAIQIQSDHLRDVAQKENDKFLKTIDENMQKIIKEQVKKQVKVQVFKILPTIEQTVNEQLEAEVLTQSSHSLKTSYAVAADLSEMELKKILIEKMEGNKDVTMMMLIRTKNPPLDRTGGPRDAEKERSLREPMQTTFQMEEPSHLEFNTGAEDQPTVQSSQHPEWFSQQQKPPTLNRDWNRTLPATHGSIQPWIRELTKQSDSHSSFNELMDTLLDFSNILINRLNVDTLTPELLAGPTYELLKGLPLGHKRQQFYGFAINRESARDVYSKRRIIAVTELKIIEWHNYKHLDWIMVQRDDDKLYKFKEGDFKRLHIQDIKDMLLLLVQGKLTNLTVEECFAFNVSLRVFTRSIMIQRCMEDLQLGVKSYQKKLNLTKLDTYRSDLKCKEAYIAYSNPRGFIYQNKDKKNRLMRIDELHKFSDGMLTDVRTALDDHLKWIRMQYLPQAIWRKSDKDRAAAMIQAIDKRLKTRRIMRSLERFVGGRLYEGDFRMLQRTI